MMRKLFNQILPFIFLGFGIVAFVFGLVLFAYLFIIGAGIGLILFTIMWIKQWFLKRRIRSVTRPVHKKGKIIDSDDWKHHS